MHVNVKIATSGEYFSMSEREIDYDEIGDNNLVSLEQADVINKIIATEVGIYLLRRASGFDGSLVDAMLGIRNNLIKDYENNYEPYVKYNDFY